MKNFGKAVTFLVVLLVAFLILLGYYFWQERKGKATDVEQVEKVEKVEKGEDKMKISSSAFENNLLMPAKYTCDGENINPPLEFSEVPKEAKSLVLVADDPDAPAGTWIHWLLWNISPEVSSIEEDEVPEGAVQGMNSFDEETYGGPCPPSGTHHYFFKLYALDTVLSLGSSATIKELEEAMKGHVLDEAELVGLYQREE